MVIWVDCYVAESVLNPFQAAIGFPTIFQNVVLFLDVVMVKANKKGSFLASVLAFAICCRLPDVCLPCIPSKRGATSSKWSSKKIAKPRIGQEFG